MKSLSLDKVLGLLGKYEIAGSEKELEKLCIRIHDLVESNSEEWVKENREKLIFEWEYIVRKGIII